MKSEVIILKEQFTGLPKENDFEIVEEDLPPLKDGEFLVETKYISLDPYVRLFVTPEKVGKPIISEQVGQIVESKNQKYPVGDYVIGEFGWRTHAIGTETPGPFFGYLPIVLKNYGALPPSLALGALGLPGHTAYLGFQNVCKPVAGNTVVVSAAAGATGNHVGQIAKLLGCRVIGITGSDEKGKRLVNEAGFDEYVNYKSSSFQEDLAKVTPNNVDCYFDCVGGEVSSAVIYRINKYGRIAVCGSMSTYNQDGKAIKASEIQTPIKINVARMEGFHVHKWQNEWHNAYEANMQWLKDGKLKYFETITEGFKNTPKAFIEMLKGANFGKAIVKLL